MWSILVGFACTVAGLFLGKVLDRGYETRRWVRDQRAKAYVSYVESFQELRQILRRLATLRTADPAGWEETRRERRNYWSTYNAALVQVELYGTVAVYSAAAAVDEPLRMLSVAVTERELSISDWHRERQPMDAAMRACIDQVRAELRLEKLPERSAWVAAAPSASEPRGL